MPTPVHSRDGSRVGRTFVRSLTPAPARAPTRNPSPSGQHLSPPIPQFTIQSVTGKTKAKEKVFSGQDVNGRVKTLPRADIQPATTRRLDALSADPYAISLFLNDASGSNRKLYSTYVS